MSVGTEGSEATALLEIMREQLRWQKVAVIPIVKDLVSSVLETAAMRAAYEMCDGRSTVRDIEAATGVSKSTVSSWSRRWRELGLAYEDDGGRIRHLISLEALGLPVDVTEPRTGRRAGNRNG
jgi:hypothetical protein